MTDKLTTKKGTTMKPTKTEKQKPIEIKPIKPTLDEIAEDIVTLSLAMEGIDKSKLKRRAVLVLLKDATGVPYITIDKVLKSLVDLRSEYLK